MKSMFNKALLVALAMVPGLAVAAANGSLQNEVRSLSALAKKRVKTAREARLAKEAANVKPVVSSDPIGDMADASNEAAADIERKQARARAQRVATHRQNYRAVLDAHRNDPENTSIDLDGIDLSDEQREAWNAEINRGVKQEVAALNPASRWQRFKGFVSRNAGRAYKRMSNAASRYKNYWKSDWKGAARDTGAVLVATYLGYKLVKAGYTKAKNYLGYGKTKSTKKKKSKKAVRKP